VLEIDNNTKAYLQNRVAKEDGSTFPETILLDTISYNGNGYGETGIGLTRWE